MFRILGSVPISMYLAAIIALVGGDVHAASITIPIKNDNKTKTISDITFKITAQGKITDVPDIDSFNAPDKKDLGKSTLTLNGGTIAAGGTTSVVLNTNKAAPVIDVIGISFTDGTKRGTSKGDEIFSLAVAGGSFGKNFAGVNIPANEFGYFYEFDRSALFSASPNRFEIITGGAPSSFGVLDNSWPVADLLSDLPVNIINGGTVSGLDDHMVADNLTGDPGIAPAAWIFARDRMRATYLTPFNVNDVSSVLWFTAAQAPAIGGPLGADGQNAVIFAGDSVLFTNGVVSTMIPEPSSVVLITCGLMGLAASRWRYHRSSRVMPVSVSLS